MEADRPDTVAVTKSLVIGREWAGLSVLDAVRRAFSELSAREIYKKCRSGGILLDEAPPDPLSPLAEGSTVSVTLHRPASYPDKPVLLQNTLVATSAGPLYVVREDEDLLAVSKHAGCASHPALRRSGDTLIERVRLHLEVGRDEEFQPALANRLDIETSGLALVGRNHNSRRRLGFDIQKRRISKRYLALVAGHTPDAGELTLPLEKKPDSRDLASYPPGHARLLPRLQEAHTRYRTVARSTAGPASSLVEVELLTGRTHQIRRHLALAGHPVALDKLYGDKDYSVELAEFTGLDRMFLHAHFLALPHPITRNIIEIASPLPGELAEALGLLGIKR